MTHFVSSSCTGVFCAPCGRATPTRTTPATHKLGEEIPHEEDEARHVFETASGPVTMHGAMRHNLTAYVCCAHFTQILGRATPCPKELLQP